MITLDDIRPMYRVADDVTQTDALKAMFHDGRTKRSPMYLTGREFDSILVWKLGRQFGRQRTLRAANTEIVVRTVTRAALADLDADADYEVELRTGLLTALRGVGVPVASAVLALAFPERFCVIDYRAWRQVFDEERDVFWLKDYQRYMAKVRPLAEELGWPIQEVDHAIWHYDQTHPWPARL